MELELHRRPVAACELLLDTTAETPIECDVLLPDYCPDIVRILCCRIQPAVTGCTVNKTVLTAEGMVTVSVCYTGEVGGIRRVEYKMPFTKSFELSGEPMRPIWSVTAEPGHINCRAASRRRVDVRGTLLLRARLFDCRERQALSEADGMGVQLKKCEESAADITGQMQRQFSVAEILTPMVGREPAAEVVEAKCTPVVQESRLTASKLLIKGELLVHLLYKTDPDSGGLETAEYTLPLSQIIDADNISGDTQCETQLSCIALSCAPEETMSDGELRLEAQLLATVRFFSPIVLSGATDSYSTLYPVQNTLSQIRVPKSCSAVSERLGVRSEAEAPQGATAVLDVWAQPFGQAVKTADDAVYVSMKVKFTVLMSAEEVGADSITHICDAEIKLPVKDAMCEYIGEAQVLAASGTLSQGRLLLGCELLLSGMTVAFEMKSFLTDLLIDESSPRAADPLLGLTIYYAERGENIWDIAKRFGSLPAQIMADNELAADVLESDMPLMIPTV